LALTIVCGPPCSGKTTYVRQHAKPQDPILDWDQVWAEVTGRPEHDRIPDRELVAATERVFRARMDALQDGWIIRTLPNKKDRAIMRRLKQAKTVVLLPSEAECMRRLAASDRVTKDYGGIRRWFAEYRPSSSADEIVIRNDKTGGRFF
jgi:predicted kinase